MLKKRKPAAARDRLTVSHRKRLIDELRADPRLASEYLLAAKTDPDARVYLAALKTVARAQN